MSYTYIFFSYQIYLAILTLYLLIRQQIANFVDGLFNLNTQYDKFRLNLRDFLISMKEFSDDNAALFIVEKEEREKIAQEQDLARRQKVGGLLKPSELEDEEL